MDDETIAGDDQPPETEGGEPGRETVADKRDGHEGYDLDEAEAYEQAQSEGEDAG